MVACFWLFAPKFWEAVGTYELLFCSKRNVASVVLTMLGGRDTQPLLDGQKKFELYGLTDSGDANTFRFSQLPSASASTISSVPYEPPGETFTT